MIEAFFHMRRFHKRGQSVSSSIPYRPVEGAKYPVETIVENKGD